MKCLVTRLQEAVTDTSLPKLNELRFNIVKRPNPNNITDRDNKGILRFMLNEPAEMELLGNAYFTNAAGANIGKTTSGVSGRNTLYVNISGESSLIFSNRTALESLGNVDGYSLFVSSSERANTNWMLQIETEDLKGIPLKSINLGSAEFIGDAANLSSTGAYVHISVNNLHNQTLDPTNATSKFYGDMTHLIEKPLRSLTLLSQRAGFDISKLNTENLASLALRGSEVTGSITDVAFPILSLLNLNVTTYGSTTDFSAFGYNIVGDICNSVKNSPNISSIQIKNMDGFYGNLGVLHDNVYTISNANGKSVFSFIKSYNRKYIISLDDVTIEQLDDFLIYMATLEKNPNFPAVSSYMLKVKGVRTEASDNAVSVLKSKGILVIVNGISL